MLRLPLTILRLPQKFQVSFAGENVPANTQNQASNAGAQESSRFPAREHSAPTLPPVTGWFAA
jgi:hypothetical protein